MPPTTASPEGAGASYASAGVDIEAGERAVDAFRPFAEKASRPEVMGGIGGFAGLFALKIGKYREPVLASSTDGVGTKIAIAQAMDKHDTIGLDLVAMVVDDLVVCGAEPLFLQDYIAVGKLVPEHVATVVRGIAEGCQLAGCALLGGETAEHPGMMEDGGYDVSATGVGIVEADAMLRPDRVRPGDVLVAMGSSGLHSNGYSLARHVLLDIARLPLEGHVEEFEHTLGEELLVPTTIYARDCLAQHVDPGADLQTDRLAWPRRAARDGEDVQHGRRDGGRPARRRRRPRAGGAHRPSRPGVGAGRGPPEQRRGVEGDRRTRAGQGRTPPLLTPGELTFSAR